MTQSEYTKQDKEFDPSIQKELDAWNKGLTQADAQLLIQREKLYQPLWEKRSEIISKIPGFWPQAIANYESFTAYFDDVDQPLIAKLKDIKIHRSSQDPRAAKIQFIFEDNDYLVENSLVKEFILKPDSKDLGDAEFEWSDDLQPLKTEIKWKSDDVNLCKLKPTNYGDAESFTPGSFFSSFFDCTNPEIANGIGHLIAETFYPLAIDWYTGEAVDEDSSFSYDEEEDFDEQSDAKDSEEDSEDDGAAEIDLEEKDEGKPAKKVKTEQ